MAVEAAPLRAQAGNAAQRPVGAVVSWHLGPAAQGCGFSAAFGRGRAAGDRHSHRLPTLAGTGLRGRLRGRRGEKKAFSPRAAIQLALTLPRRDELQVDPPPAASERGWRRRGWRLPRGSTRPVLPAGGGQHRRAEGRHGRAADVAWGAPAHAGARGRGPLFRRAPAVCCDAALRTTATHKLAAALREAPVAPPAAEPRQCGRRRVERDGCRRAACKVASAREKGLRTHLHRLMPRTRSRHTQTTSRPDDVAARRTRRRTAPTRRRISGELAASFLRAPAPQAAGLREDARVL